VAITPAPSIDHPLPSIPHYLPTQPPSYKPPEFRKSQLHRQYTSLLRSTPLIILFQHNNLRSTEWVGIRRELTIALRKVDEQRAADGLRDAHLADKIKLQIIQTSIFDLALLVAEYYNPTTEASLASQIDPSKPATKLLHPPKPGEDIFTHGLSREAYDAVQDKKKLHPLSPLLAGPVALLTFPTVSPQHLKAALSILAPKAPDFPAPRKRTHPGYHDPMVQAGLQKIFLLGARIEGKVFDMDGTRWVGKIEGGIDGLRAQVVALLQSAGGSGITQALENASRSLWMAVEGRREMLEGEERGPEEKQEG
jgi:large subunit ribosomal protein L10